MRLLPYLTLLLPLSVLAGSPQPLSLSEVEALWQTNNRDLKLAKNAIEGAEADLLTAGQIPNPQVSYDMLAISPWSGLGSGSLEYRKLDSVFRIEQLIERGDKRGLRTQGAEARLAATRFDYDAVRLQQLAELRRAYFDLQLAQEKFRLMSEAADLYQRGLDAAQKRQKAGDIAPVDVSRLAVDKARADNDARSAKSEFELAQQQLAYLVGRPASEDAIQTTGEWPTTDDEPLATPARTRPEIKASGERITAAERDRDLARASRTRDVTLGLQYEHTRQNTPIDSVGIGFSIPLFLWHNNEGAIRRAESDLHNARLQDDVQRAQLQTQLAQARSALLAARDRVKRLDGGLVADADRVAKAAELAYTKGAMGLMDLLDARRTLRQVQLEAVTARADYAKAWSDWQLQALNEK